MPGSGGPYSEFAGRYQKSSLVEYHSHTHKDWLPATVVNVDVEGRIVIDLKPNTWINLDTQAHDVRPRRSSPGYGAAMAGAAVACAAGVATPLRQRSPSIGAPIGSARGSTPQRGRDMSPTPAPFLGGVPARAMTPSR